MALQGPLGPAMLQSSPGQHSDLGRADVKCNGTFVLHLSIRWREGKNTIKLWSVLLLEAIRESLARVGSMMAYTGLTLSKCSIGAVYFLDVCAYRHRDSAQCSNLNIPNDIGPNVPSTCLSVDCILRSLHYIEW